MKFFFKNTTWLLLSLALLLNACGNNKTTDSASNNNSPAYQNPTIKPLTDAIEANPKQADLYYQRAEALSQMRLDSLALVDVEKAISLDPQNPQYTFTKGYLEIELGKAKTAVTTLLKNLDQSPGNVSTRLLLAKAYMLDNNIADAKKQLNTVLAAAPEHKATQLMFAQVEMADKDTTAAEARLQKLLSQDKNNYEASYVLGELYAGQSDLRAVSQLQATFLLDTLDASPLYDIGVLYEKLGQNDKARDAFVYCLTKDEDYTGAYIRLGDLYFKGQDVLKALRHYQLAIDTDPQNGMAYYKKGLCLEKLQQRDSAKLAFYQAIVFDSKLKDAKAAFERVK